MGISVKVNIRELVEFGRTIENLKEAPGRISAELALTTLRLVAEGFAREADPEGRGWAPRVVEVAGRDPGRPILVLTGRMKASFRIIRANARGFVVGTSVRYAGYHQRGTKRMARRSMVPLTGRVPAAWQQEWERVATEVLERAVG